ncbi:MAG: hypothetical protein AB6733_23200 [Clostridiaceae bacterium]
MNKNGVIKWSIIIGVLIIIIGIIIGIKISTKKTTNFEVIIVTEEKMTVDEVKTAIINSLEQSDSKLQVSVKESSDDVVTLENNFVSELSTTLNKDEVLKILSNYKGFKYVQENHIFKIQD